MTFVIFTQKVSDIFLYSSGEMWENSKIHKQTRGNERGKCGF